MKSIKIVRATVLPLVFFVLLPSVPLIRTILASPLVTSDDDARGDACYVLASGNAIWERLSAASNLYQTGRIAKIILMNNNTNGPYNFATQTSWTQTQWASSYLAWRGVPRQSIRIINGVNGFFGTLVEARNVKMSLTPDIRQLVLVTSAPHTRRSLLAFQRVMPGSVKVVPYAASSIASSTQLFNPLWLEYLKLFVYAVFLFH